MAGSLSLDDKLLGEKTHNYCSSSEDEDSSDLVLRDSDATARPAGLHGAPAGDRASNTGPKGVIADWRKFKQLETEMKQEQDKERAALAKKLAFTCRSHLDDERDRALAEERLAQAQEDDSDDEFLKEYRLKRIEEMRQKLYNKPMFGLVRVLRSQDEFLQAVDQEDQQTTVIVHIYEDDVDACVAMDRCLSCLASSYPTVKFCAIKASQVNLSSRFSELGVPALLAYKGGDLVTSLVGMSQELGGSDFYADEVEVYLQTHGLLPSDGPRMSRSGPRQQRQTLVSSDDDSDFEVD